MHTQYLHCNGACTLSAACSILDFLRCTSLSSFPSFFLLVPRDRTGHVDSRACWWAQSTCQHPDCKATGSRRAGGARGESTHSASFFSPIFLRRCWSTLETPTVIFVRSGVAHVPIGSQLVFGLRSRCIEIHGVSFLDTLRNTRTHSKHICMCTREALGLGFRVYAFVLYAYQRVPRGRPAS